MKEKKKAIIITIYDPNPNMGNRLQNYAVQEVLKKMNLEVTSIAFRNPTMTYKKKIKYLVHKVSGYRFTKNKDFWKYMPPQIKVFDQFNKNYIETKFVKNVEDMPQADFYVVGSDQVWNPQWWSDGKLEMAKNIYLATFAKPEQIVCFSPSFGVENLPMNWQPWFKEHLSRFPFFSVREETGKKIIKEITGKNAVVTIDPTLMLERKEWDRIATDSINISRDSNYILTYFLGGRSEKINKDIERYARELGALVYNLFDKENKDLFFASPSDFIYMISHAKLILTDSFHACVFSFIYGKPFLVYNRIGASGMMSRMDTLFDKFDLRRKYVGSGLDNDILECDYQIGYEKLMEERHQVEKFLKKSMRLD